MLGIKEGDLMENKEQTAQFDFIEGSGIDELVKKLNEKAQIGYFPVWPSHKTMFTAKDEFFIVLNYHEPVDTQAETDIKAEISSMILEAEFQVAKANSDLEDAKYKLNFKTNWEEAAKKEKLENPIKTVGDKASYVIQKTKKQETWYNDCKSWLSHLKRLEKIKKLPTELSPWEKKKQELEPEPVKRLGKESQKEFPENSVELENINYCGDNIEKECDVCLNCEKTKVKESE